jgi:hypothetical protein
MTVTSATRTLLHRLDRYTLRAFNPAASPAAAARLAALGLGPAR